VDYLNAAYVEVGGPSVIYSVNYERRVYGPLWYRIGGSYLVLRGRHTVDSHFGLTGLVGGNYHHLELAGMVTPVYGFANSDQRAFANVIWSAAIGYRYQPPSSGFLFRLVITPVVDRRGWNPWFGAGVGWRF